MKILSGEWIGDYAYPIRNFDVVIDLPRRLELTNILKDFSTVRVLSDGFLVDARPSFLGRGISYNTSPFRHFELSPLVISLRR